MILCKIFFQLIVTVLQKRPKLTATLLYLPVVLLLYLKQYFFSKKLERTGLEQSKLFNVFSYMILQFKLKTACKILTILYDFKGKRYEDKA